MSTVTARMTTAAHQTGTAQTKSIGLTAKLYRSVFARPALDDERRGLLNQLSQWRWRDGCDLDEISQRMGMTREILDECCQSFQDLDAVLCSRSRVLSGELGEPRSVRQSANAIGISPKALRRRLTKMDPNEALRRPRESGPKIYEVDGVRQSQQSWAIALKIPTSTLSYRLRKRVAEGETEHQALEREILLARSRESERHES